MRGRYNIVCIQSEFKGPKDGPLWNTSANSEQRLRDTSVVLPERSKNTFPTKMTRSDAFDRFNTNGYREFQLYYWKHSMELLICHMI